MYEAISFLRGQNLSIILVLVTGLLTLLWAIIMHFTTIRYISRPPLNPDKNPLGFKKRILWLELVDREDEVFNILDNPGTEAGLEIRRLVNQANLLDNIFIFIYSGFNASLFYFVFKLTDSIYTPFFIFGLVLSVVMLIADFLENVQIYKLTKAKSVEDLKRCGVICIQLWARLKWGTIALACLILAIFFAKWFVNRFKGFLTGRDDATWELIWFIIPILFLATGISVFLSISINTLRNDAEKAMNFALIPAWLTSLIYAVFLLFNQ